MRRHSLFAATLLIVLTLAVLTVAYAADAPKAPAECASVADCQKEIHALTAQSVQSQATIQLLGRQVSVYKTLLTESNDRLVAAGAQAGK